MPPNLVVAAATLVDPQQSERKSMRKTIGVATLLLTLVCSAHAGEMQNGSPAPQSQPTNAIQEPTTDGDMPNGAADSLTQIALDLLALLPSLY
jgi:hypothetical protein